jgi:alkylation response protein AidB-like acyl-CoA dehydrogenase
VDLRETRAEQEFRHEVRAWATRWLPSAGTSSVPLDGRFDERTRREWTRAMAEAGYAGLTWPVDYGGRGWPVDMLAVFLEETTRLGTPEHIGIVGVNVAGPIMMDHGTRDQQDRYLRRILSGDDIFCLGLSEPDAGSDLAAVRTSAREVPGGYAVDGCKVWSSYAHLAQHCVVLARTGATADRHRGLTCLVVDMSAPGVTVRGIRQLTGDAEFNEIVFDGVRVPSDDVLGRPGDGWRVAMTGLTYERGVLGFTLTCRLVAQFERLVATVQLLGHGGDPLVLDRLGELAASVAGVRWLGRRALTGLAAGVDDGRLAPAVKLRWSETNQQLTATAIDLLGPSAQLTGPEGFWGGYWQHHHLRSRGNSIEGGTSEILRNVIAERVLGLPRSR